MPKKQKTYTKAQLTAGLAETHDLTKAQTREVIETFLGYIQGALEEGNRVSLSGFGSFYPHHVKARKARTGTNPFTGEENYRFKAKPAKTVPKFRASKALKDAL